MAFQYTSPMAFQVEFQGPIFLKQYNGVVSLPANARAAFKCEDHCHWLILATVSLQQINWRWCPHSRQCEDLIKTLPKQDSYATSVAGFTHLNPYSHQDLSHNFYTQLLDERLFFIHHWAPTPIHSAYWIRVDRDREIMLPKQTQGPPNHAWPLHISSVWSLLSHVSSQHDASFVWNIYKKG